MAEIYHPPPATPRDEIWAGIEGRLRSDARPGIPGSSREIAGRGRGRTAELAGTASTAGGGGYGWTARLAAAVALIALGFGAGRVSFDDGAPPAGEAAGTPGRQTAESPVGVPTDVDEEALDYLTRSGTLLASVRSDAREGVVGPGVGPWGRGLLLETRLMLDSPAADDAAMRALLEDLELVLAQVALLSDRGRVGEERGREELRLIARGLDRRDLLPRINAALPTGADPRTEEGDR